MPRPGVKLGCATIVFCLLAAAVVGLSNFSWMGGGDRSAPILSVERTLAAHVDLDAAHPSAVQRFTVKSMDAGHLSLSAHAAPGFGIVSLTILVGDGTSLTESWDEFRGGGGNGVELIDSTGADVDLSRQFVALVELADPNPARPVPVDLTMTARSDFVGSMATPAATLTAPPDFALSVVAVSPISTASVSKVRASYQETIQVAAGPSQRVLRLEMSGAALPVSAGGSGQPMIVATVMAYTMSGTGGEMYVHGAIQPLSAPIAWSFTGSSEERYADANRGSGGDPSPACKSSGGSCHVDLAIDLQSQGYVYPLGSASPDNVPMTVTFEVDAIDFLIGVPVVPDGAAMSLTSVPAVTSPNAS